MWLARWPPSSLDAVLRTLQEEPVVFISPREEPRGWSPWAARASHLAVAGYLLVESCCDRVRHMFPSKGRGAGCVLLQGFWVLAEMYEITSGNEEVVIWRIWKKSLFVIRLISALNRTFLVALFSNLNFPCDTWFKLQQSAHFFPAPRSWGNLHYQWSTATWQSLLLLLMMFLSVAFFSSLSEGYSQLSWSFCIPTDCWNQLFIISLPLPTFA